MTKRNLKSPVIYKTKYNVQTASQLNTQISEEYATDETKRVLLTEFPTVYVINDPINSKRSQYTVYVGETNDIQRRTLQHLDADPAKRDDFFNFKNSKNANMFVIGHEHFNKSMTLDIENRLMQYLSSVPAVHRLNNRRHNEQNRYYDSDEFNSLFDLIWKKLGNQNDDLFPARKIIESSAIFKASPFNKLTNEQLLAKSKVIDKINETLFVQKNKNLPEGQLILVEGNAGSGKTVLMSNIFYDLVHEDQISAKEQRGGKKAERLSVAMIVNQNEQLKVYEEISQKLFDKDEQVLVAKPITFINKVKPSKKIDIALIDEAHLLLTQRNQAYAKYGKNMLEDILKRAKVVMAVYDPAQVLSIASVLEDEKFADLERKAGKENIIYLKNQMRIDASQATIDWLRNLIDNGIINKIPQDSKYQIKVFKTPEEMQKAIEEKNKDQKNGISRMVATFDWEYSGGKTQPPKNQKYWEVSEGDWHMPWNYEINKRDKYESKHRAHRTVKYSNQSWAEKDYTIAEIGSTYTVQGFDLNYVGVELGPSVKYRNGRIIHDPAESSNSKATQKRDSTKSYADMLLKNEFNVLMTRGVHGLYIHAVDPELQKALEKAKNN